jgi:hypothetical protein
VTGTAKATTEIVPPASMVDTANVTSVTHKHFENGSGLITLRRYTVSMKRTILQTDGGQHVKEVGTGFETWNDAIGASTGTLVVSPDRTLEFWCDDEGLCCEDPQLNREASMLAGQQLVGDVIVFFPGDVT